MKKLTIFMFALFVASSSARAQQENPMKFAEWDPKPHVHPVPKEHTGEHAIMLLYSEKRDYVFEGGNTTMYNTIHRIVKVLDRTGIESFNTMEVPFRTGHSRIDSVKARVILPDGTTRNMKYEMLLIGNGGLFFALDGVEKNAEIEVVVKYKQQSSYFGSVQFQHRLPVLNTYFELNYPKEFTFNTKGYHGFPSGQERVVGGHKQIKIYKADIPALEKQPYSFYDLYCMRLEYGIDHFTQWGGYQREDAITWNDLAKDNYEEFYKMTEKDKKAATAFLSVIGVRGNESEQQKIKLIEDGIKTNIVQYWELSGRDAENLDTVTTKKSASEQGIVKLFCACLTMAGIQHELGVTSDRTEHTFDPNFVNLAPLDHYVLYFPGTGRYLAPAEPYYRYPEIPYTMIATKGVFCRTNPESEFNIGKEVTEAEAIIRTIDPMSIADTRENLNADVKLDSELNAGIALNYSYTGYSASDKRATLAKASAKAREDYIKDLVGFDVDNKPELLVKYNTQNEGFNDVYKKKPFILTAEVRDPSLVEKAGEKYLVMLGSVVGSQKNMYTRDERILPVDIDYPHTTVRTVTLTIPEGYKILNPESLRIHSEHDDIDNGNTTASFHSDYQLNGNKLVVTITESYTRLHYPVAEYDRFKQVINAAADFSKVALVMEKDKKFFAKKKHKTAVSTAKAKAGAKTTVAKVAAPKAAAAKTTTVKTASVKAATPAKPAKAAKPTEKPGGNVMRQL